MNGATRSITVEAVPVTGAEEEQETINIESDAAAVLNIKLQKNGDKIILKWYPSDSGSYTNYGLPRGTVTLSQNEKIMILEGTNNYLLE